MDTYRVEVRCPHPRGRRPCKALVGVMRGDARGWSLESTIHLRRLTDCGCAIEPWERHVHIGGAGGPLERSVAARVAQGNPSIAFRLPSDAAMRGAVVVTCRRCGRTYRLRDAKLEVTRTAA